MDYDTVTAHDAIGKVRLILLATFSLTLIFDSSVYKSFGNYFAMCSATALLIVLTG